MVAGRTGCSYIEIDQDADLAYIANAGISPSTVIRCDLSTDDLTILEENEHGSLGVNGMSLSLAPAGNSFVYPCGGGNGSGYTVYLTNAEDFTDVFGEFDIGTYPHFMEYDPQGEFLAGINGDPYDERLYLMNPSNFNPIIIHNVQSWFTHDDPYRSEDPQILQINYDGSILVLYVEDTYDELDGHFFLIPRNELFFER